MKRRILVLPANPQNMSHLHLAEEVRHIEEGLRRAQWRNEFEINQRWAVRFQDIRRVMLEVAPNIVHFSGHGGGEPGITFEDEAGKTHLDSTEALANFFALFANTVECIVLNACYSEVQARAIAKHIPYVIGMSDEISDRAAQEFSVAFYDTLGAGRSVPTAFQIACNAIQLTGLEEYQIPVLIEKEGGETPIEEPPVQQPSTSPEHPKEVPFDLRNRISAFLSSLSMLKEKDGRRTFITSAGLDPALEAQINVDLTPIQFCPLLVSTAVSYGTLQDGRRHALEAILKAAHPLVGQEKQRVCEHLLQDFYAFWRPGETQHTSVPSQQMTKTSQHVQPSEHLDTSILRVLYVYYRENSGDPEMSMNEVLQQFPGHSPESVRTELFTLKKKGWIGYEMNESGTAGLMWIEPKGIKIAKQLA